MFLKTFAPQAKTQQAQMSGGHLSTPIMVKPSLMSQAVVASDHLDNSTVDSQTLVGIPDDRVTKMIFKSAQNKPKSSTTLLEHEQTNQLPTIQRTNVPKKANRSNLFCEQSEEL